MRRAGGLLVVSLVLASSVLMPARAQTPPDCPPVMPVSEVRRGMVGEGRTVSSGRTVETFTAEVLGVLTNGIGPGRDMIVIEAHSPAIDEVGGIWFGMSGSPVYIDGRLVGAVAFGLSGGPSPIAGVTPAQHMLDMLSYPTEPESASEPSYARRARLTEEMRREIAQRQGTSSSEVGDLRRLHLPLSISGLGGHAFDEVAARIVAEKGSWLPYVGGSRQADAQPLPPEPDVVPGSSFASVISYGDVTAAGIGTTTIVCGGRALAFGHPFASAPQGSTVLGANLSDAIAIVDDDFGPFKLGTVAETVGIVDQDRFAGIRARLGTGPVTIPVSSTVTSPDTARNRTGESRVVNSEFVPGITFAHVLGNMDMTFDQIGQGSSSLSWHVTGTTEEGTPWELTRSNLFTSEFDISVESLFELQSQLFNLFFNEFEEITFTSVGVTASVTDEVRLYTIEKVEAAAGGAPYREVRRIRARPGARIRLRVTLDAKTSDTDQIAELRVRLPRNAEGDAFIDVVGGREEQFAGECFFEGEDCFDPRAGRIDSFDELIASLESKPKNNDLIARLFTRGIRPKDEDIVSLDQVVGGFFSLRVRVLSGCCGGRARG